MSDLKKEIKKTDAKNISKWSMVIGAVLIVGYNVGVLFWKKEIPNLEEQKSIIMFGGSIMLLFSPVYLSIILDKLVEIFKKGSN